MSLFAQLLDKVADQECPVSSCLLLAKRLAVKLSSEPFRQWVGAELEGYGSQDVPSYRIVRTELKGHVFLNCLHDWRDSNITSSLNGLTSNLRDRAEASAFSCSIGALEEKYKALQEGNRNGQVGERVRLPETLLQELKLALKPRSEEIGFDEILFVYHTITPTIIGEVLHAVRNRLQDFLLELMKQYPELENNDSAASSIPLERVAQTFGRTIHTFHNCNFASGDQKVAINMIHAEGSISVGGHFVMADAIDNAFNSIGAVPEGRKELLQELGIAVKSTAQSLTEEKQRQVAEDYRQLVV
jgi:AbiTii